MSKKKYKIYTDNLYILLIGIITSFSLPPYNAWLVNFFTFSLLFIFLLKNKFNKPKYFFLYGYCFGFGYLASSLYWIPLSLLYDDNFKYLTPIAMIMIPAFLSIFYALAFYIFRFFLSFSGVFVNILTFSLVLGIFEFLRGQILSGFPWNLFAYSFLENLKFIQINSIIGIYSFNTILITIFSVPAIILLSKKKKDLFGFFLILIFAASTYYYGNTRIESFKNLKSEFLPTEIKVLSTNISIERFYSNLDDEEIIMKLINLSNPSHNEKVLYIWPEGVIPNNNLKSLKNEYDYLFNKYFSKNHNIILGINDEELVNKKQKFYNSLLVIDNDVNVISKYYKNKLVPFGEFLPLEKALYKLGLKSLTNNYQSYSFGTERKLINVGKNSEIKLLPLICYEIIYSGQLTKYNDYNFIVNISEDGWFGNSIGPHQHFAHSIFRSIEYGKYTLRSANNGISAIIDPVGSTSNKINIQNEGVISINEITNIDNTLFSVLGNKIYFLIILLYLFLIFSFKKIENE